jgi:uncharacterized protein (TIGR03067 family)
MNRFRVSLAALFCLVGLAALGAQADVAQELKRFQGAWTIESSVTGGMELPADQLKGLIVTFEGNRHTVQNGDQVVQAGTQTIDPSKSPKTIDVTITEGPSKGAVMLGIYEIEGDTLKACFDPEGKARPTKFTSATGSTHFVNIHKRIKK